MLFFCYAFFYLKIRRAKKINAEENVTREREQRQEKGNVREHKCFFFLFFLPLKIRQGKCDS